MKTLGVILARAGSKGLPDKCMRLLLGQPMIAYTFQHALASAQLAATVLTTDSSDAAALAQAYGLTVIDRPAELATDTAPVDAAVRHAVETYERRERESGAPADDNPPVDAVAILYGNVPVRAADIIDRCVAHLAATGSDSVRTVAPVSKQHPDWLHRLDGDRMSQFRPNSIHRRQDLEPLFYHDGAVVLVRREPLFAPATATDPHAFFGTDRRALRQHEDDTVDVDTLADLYRAEAILRSRQKTGHGRASHR